MIIRIKNSVLFVMRGVLIALLLSTIATNLFAQNLISVSFANGFVGNNSANNQSTNAYYTNSLGWSKLQFAQTSTSNIFVAQGNDIIGMVVVTDASGVKQTINGYVKWRAPSGSVTTMVFSPSETKTLATNGVNGTSTYTISPTKYIGLTFNGSTLSITGGTASPGGTVSGNAATSGLLQALNDYLALQPKINVSSTSKSVNENASTVSLTVTLNAAATSSVSFKYATADGTAIAGSDYTAASGTVTFAPGEVTKTITIPILDDVIGESIEDFEINLTDPVNAAIISGLTHVSIIDNDNVTPTVGASANFVNFSSCEGSASNVQQFSVVGSNLTSNYVINAPTGFELATSANGTYSNSLTLGNTNVSITPGAAEYTIIEPNAFAAGESLIEIDLRVLGTVAPSDINSIKLLDIYDGPVTYVQTSPYWAVYKVYSTLPGIATSAYQSSIRSQSTWYAIMSQFDFTGATQLFARVAASASAGNLSGNITVASSGATTINIPVSGTVTATPSQPSAITGSALVKANTSYTFSVPAVSGATGYTWTLPNGWTGSSTSNSITLTTDASSGSIEVTADNGSCSSLSRTLAIAVDSTPPTITGPNGNSGTTTGATASKSIPENTVNVYTFTADEPVTWSITGGADQAKFIIDPATGALRFVSPPDYETPTDVNADNVYLVVLTATDAAGNVTTQTVSVTVTFVCGGAIYGTGYLSGGTGADSNWKVVALPQGFTPPQAVPYNAYVINGILPGSFVNRNGYTNSNGDTFYWVAPKADASSLISGNYNWIIEQTFTVPRTGFYDLSFSGAGDNEIGFYINGSIDTSDPLKPIITGGTQIGSTWNSFSNSTTFAGKAYLTAGVNHAYMVMRDYGGLTTAIISGGSFSCTPLLNGPGSGLTSTKTIPENTTDVFTFTSDEPVTWSLSGGEDLAKFSINASGKLVFVSAPDFENPTDGSTTGSNSYIVVVKALSTLSGLYTEQTVTVYVTDVDEVPPTITGPNGSGGTTTGANSALTVPENTVPVYTFTANEPVTWSLGGGADQARFTINPTTGLLSFNPGPDYENPSDADHNNIYIVVIKATDAAGNITTQTFTVTVTDVVENLAPTNITLSKMNVFEANTIGAVIGNLTSTDPDVGDTHTYTLVNGNGSSGNAYFTISGGQLKAGVIFSYIAQSSYSIRIRTTDAGGLWYEKVFTISISETPVVQGTGYNITTGITPASSNPVISKGYFSNLTVNGTNLVSYSWTPVLRLSSTNISNPTASPSQTTTYAVTVTNSFGSSTTLYITVTVVEDYNITPRNAMTPNGDGVNDNWVIENISSYPNNQVLIYDRAGRLLYAVSNYQNTWDGTVNGVPLKEDTYFYVIKFGAGINPKKGFISIIR